MHLRIAAIWLALLLAGAPVLAQQAPQTPLEKAFGQQLASEIEQNLQLRMQLNIEREKSAELQKQIEAMKTASPLSTQTGGGK